MLFNGTKYIPTIGTSYESFLMTIAGCLMTTTVISVSYFLSKNTEVLVRSTLFVRIINNKKVLVTLQIIVFQEIIFGLFAAACYFGSSSLLTIAIYATLYPIIMTISFISLFSGLLLAHVRKTINSEIICYLKTNSFNIVFQTLGFVLGVLYAIDAYWAFKYYNGFL